MPDNPDTLLSAIIQLTPVIGGAAIGVVGGLIGTTYAHKLSSSAEKTKEKKEKLETLVTEAFEIEIWVRKQENYYLYGGDEPLEQSPISKIEALQCLYFPELLDQVTELSESALNYRGWLIEGAQLRLAAKTYTPPQQHLDRVIAYYNPLKQSVNKVIDAANNLSRKIDRS